MEAWERIVERNRTLDAWQRQAQEIEMRRHDEPTVVGWIEADLAECPWCRGEGWESNGEDDMTCRLCRGERVVPLHIHDFFYTMRREIRELRAQLAAANPNY